MVNRGPALATRIGLLLLGTFGIALAGVTSAGLAVARQAARPQAVVDTAESNQPSAPIRAAFFYPWYRGQWASHSNYEPLWGYYQSENGAIIDKQLRRARRAGIEAFISSWWGPRTQTDRALRVLLNRTVRPGSPNPGLRWGIYYEREGYSNPSPAEISDDLHYLEQTVFGHAGYLRVDGKPVVFVWAGADDDAGMAERWNAAKNLIGRRVYVVLKIYTGYDTDKNQPDSWHQYVPTLPRDVRAPYSFTVSPGFWKIGEEPRLARDPGRFEADVRRMARSGAFWQLITTWNEWNEGTSVEPSMEYGNRYIRILCRHLNPEKCGTAGAPRR